MKKICKITNKEFEITEKDLEFYEKMGVPVPTLCPEERQRRRFSFRNERHMYYRECDGTGKKIVSFYSSEKTFPVYDKDYWWGDNWDALEYGVDFDFEKSFFEQWKNFRNKVPRMSMMGSHCENCDWSPYGVSSKNCYLSISCCDSEDVHFSFQVNKSSDCIDCSLLNNCNNCYESINCKDSYKIFYSQFCNNCSSSWFLKNCNGCTDCFACVDLDNKKYHILNKEYSKEKYFEIIKNFNLDKNSSLEKKRKGFLDFVKQFPHKYMFGNNNENCSGDNLHNSSDSKNCFDAYELENCKNIIFNPYDLKESQDVNYSPSSELLYDCLSACNSYNSSFLLYSWDIKNSQYCDECFYCEDIFLCAGLKNKKYCILNKQYSKENYFKLKEKIINFIKDKGEYGNFFPISVSPYSYNETIAQDFFPLKKEDSIKLGYSWKIDENKTIYNGKIVEIQDSIKDVDEEILSQILTCENCSKNYKISKVEYNFYKKHNLPIPRNCPNCRHLERIKLRNPRKLFDRKCDKCKVDMKTTYNINREENIYCEDCYEKEIN